MWLYVHVNCQYTYLQCSKCIYHYFYVRNILLTKVKENTLQKNGNSGEDLNHWSNFQFVTQIIRFRNNPFILLSLFLVKMVKWIYLDRVFFLSERYVILSKNQAKQFYQVSMKLTCIMSYVLERKI